MNFREYPRYRRRIPSVRTHNQIHPNEFIAYEDEEQIFYPYDENTGLQQG